MRIHRAGEGAPFTGILPAGTPVDPAVALADEALSSGSADKLAKGIAHHVDEGIRERFARAAAAKKQANVSVAAGREFVEAYVELTHYVERLHLDATTPAAHGPGGARGRAQTLEGGKPENGSLATGMTAVIADRARGARIRAWPSPPPDVLLDVRRPRQRPGTALEGPVRRPVRFRRAAGSSYWGLKPVPLYGVLAKMGFSKYGGLGAEGFRVTFRRKRHGRGAMREVLDLRGLPPPEPLVRDARGGRALPKGEELVVLTERRPVHLLPILWSEASSVSMRELRGWP